jgi:hypothetical protein
MMVRNEAVEGISGVFAKIAEETAGPCPNLSKKVEVVIPTEIAKLETELKSADPKQALALKQSLSVLKRSLPAFDLELQNCSTAGLKAWGSAKLGG